MRTGSRSNALLVELLIVVMFFMLASTILLRVFVSSRQQSGRSEMLTRSLAEAQNVADLLYAAGDPEELLGSLGFTREDALWVRMDENYRIEALIAEEKEAAGTFRRQTVQVSANGETLFSLPCSRWLEVNP